MGVIVEVHGSVLVLIELEFGALGVSSTERGGAGPSAAGSASRACRPRWRCHGRALARMRPRGEQRGDGQRGTALSRRSCPLSAVTGSRPPQDTPARAARGATDAGKTPSAHAGVLAREKKPRATRQAHCLRVIETDGRKRHRKLNLSEYEQQQCTPSVRQNDLGM